VIAMGSHQRLLLMGNLLARSERLKEAVTTEAEALASVALHRPDLLFCSDWLESGSIVSVIQRAVQDVPGLRVLMIVSQREQLPALGAIQPIVDAMVLEHDLSGEEAHLRNAFIALARARRYRSTSLRASSSAEARGGQPVPAGVRLTPREAEVWERISQGLKDREIAEALGISHETTRSHVKSLRRKLGGGNRLTMAAKRWGV